MLNHGVVEQRCHWLPLAAALWICCTLTSCAGAGPYGFSKHYEPIDGEADAAQGARRYDPVMAGRKFQDWVGKRVSVFGVVKSRRDDESGNVDLALSIRTRQARNLCETTDDETCRMTVSDHEFGVVHAFVKLAPGDAAGKLKLGQGSLVRVIGKVSKKTHPHTGNTVIEADFYRHWPHGYFVTTKAREYMRL